MAWALGAAGAIAHAGNTDVTPLAVAYPSGITAGQALQLDWSASNDATPVTPAGWTVLASRHSSRGSIYLLGKIADGTESGTLSVTSSANTATQGVISRWTGGPTTVVGIVHASGERSTGSGLNIIGTPALTISQANCLVRAIGSKPCNGSAIGLPAGFTNEIAEGVHSTTKCMASDYVVQTTATNIAQDNWSVGTNDVATASCGLVVALLSSVAAPAITNVDGDNDVTGTQAGVVMPGANFEASQGTGGVTLWDGPVGASISSPCTVTSWGASSITFTVVQGNVRFGTGKFIEVRTNGGLSATKAVTLSPASGTSYVDAAATLRPLTYDSRGRPSRLTPKASLADAVADCVGAAQFKVVRTGGTGTSTPDPDGRLQVADTVTQDTWYWHDTLVYQGPIVWDWGGLFPDFIGPAIVPLKFTQNSAITSINFALLFNANGGTITYTLQGGAIAGLSLSSSGVLTGTPTTVSTYTNRFIRATNSEGHYVDSNLFSIQVEATPNAPFFAGEIPKLVDDVNTTFSYDTSAFFNFCTAFSLAGALPTGWTFHTGTGIIDGTSTVVGLFDGLVVTGTGTGSPAVSNPFSAEIRPVGSIAVPNLSGLSAAPANSAITGAALVVGVVGTQTTTDTTKLDKVVAQSPDAGDLVLPGTAVNYSLGVLQNPEANYFLPTH